MSTSIALTSKVVSAGPPERQSPAEIAAPAGAAVVKALVPTTVTVAAARATSARTRRDENVPAARRALWLRARRGSS
ncbi:MAG TPA: hypothetical protein VJ872_19165, partial [Nocardioides sp.]|nr:hypothetical protein [Nocardioides sp.]